MKWQEIGIRIILQAYAFVIFFVTCHAGLLKNSRVETRLQSSILGNLGMKLGLVRVADSSPLPCALSFRSSLHSGEEESGSGIEGNGVPVNAAVRNPTTTGPGQILNRAQRPRVNTRVPQISEAGENLNPVDYPQGFFNTSDGIGRSPWNRAGGNLNGVDYLREKIRNGETGQPPLPPPVADSGRIPRPRDYMYGSGSPWFQEAPQLESNADIVHIKFMRNNSYVTLTDYKGDKKLSVSTGQVVAKGEQLSRYSAEAAAEYMGRVAKQMRVKSVVVKVSGHIYFRRKRDAILAFKDGYTHSRGDVNPIVYIEDTTRKPHNGCRRKKPRRI